MASPLLKNAVFNENDEWIANVIVRCANSTNAPSAVQQRPPVRRCLFGNSPSNSSMSWLSSKMNKMLREEKDRAQRKWNLNVQEDRPSTSVSSFAWEAVAASEIPQFYLRGCHQRAVRTQACENVDNFGSASPSFSASPDILRGVSMAESGENNSSTMDSSAETSAISATTTDSGDSSMVSAAARVNATPLKKKRDDRHHVQSVARQSRLTEYYAHRKRSATAQNPETKYVSSPATPGSSRSPPSSSTSGRSFAVTGDEKPFKFMRM